MSLSRKEVKDLPFGPSDGTASLNLSGVHIALCKNWRQEHLVAKLTKQSIAESVSQGQMLEVRRVCIDASKLLLKPVCLSVAVPSGTFRGVLPSCFGACSPGQHLPASHSWCFAVVTPPRCSDQYTGLAAALGSDLVCSCLIDQTTFHHGEQTVSSYVKALGSEMY